MAPFKLSIDEDILLIRTSPSILNGILFFKRWSYVLELPVHRIARVELERRAGILTLIVVKISKDGREKHIAVSLLKASRKQVNFIKNALPKIIENRPNMHEINEYIADYLK
jgi:hypothetical protein